MNLSDAIITGVTGIMTVHSKKGESSKMKNRPTYGLSLCYNGQIVYKQNGREYLSNKDTAVILPEGESYTIIREATGDFPVINFTTLKPLSDTVKTIKIRERELILKKFDEIKRLFVDGQNKPRIMALFYEILDELTAAREYGVLDPAVKFIYNNYHTEGINNSTLAQICGFSEVYFRRLFKESFKTTPKQFILNLRLEKAKLLLREGREKIFSISERCGFSSQYHFCRAFKDQLGITPTEYREKNIFKSSEFE